MSPSSFCFALFFLSSVIISTYAQNPTYVTFRLDDIQDYWVEDVQIAVMDIFRLTKQPLTIGIIANHFGLSPKIVNYVKNYVQNAKAQGFDLDLANHGWEHEDFATFTQAQQYKMLSDSSAKTVADLGLPAGSKITNFIPPFNSFNANTVLALKQAGYRMMSSSYDFYSPSSDYPGSDPVFKHYPIGSAVGTNLADNGYMPTTDSMFFCNQQIAHSSTYKFCSVMLHFASFVDAETGKTNQSAIAELQDFIAQTQRLGWKMTTTAGLDRIYFPSSGSSSTSTSTSGSVPSSTSTTGKPATPSTTAKPVTSTSTSTSSTTGKSSTSTSTTGSATSTSSTSGSSSAYNAPGSSCASYAQNSVGCSSPNSFTICSWGTWSPSQQCQSGLVCKTSSAGARCDWA